LPVPQSIGTNSVPEAREGEDAWRESQLYVQETAPLKGSVAEMSLKPSPRLLEPEPEETGMTVAVGVEVEETLVVVAFGVVEAAFEVDEAVTVLETEECDGLLTPMLVAMAILVVGEAKVEEAVTVLVTFTVERVLLAEDAIAEEEAAALDTAETLELAATDEEWISPTEEIEIVAE
jgi:hypothetical protein